ncbi:hypothetical protein BDA96_09G255500 [Sorghum bicolor]|uniref:Uncharacterized protein n=2 Tax=Sorghum bicolor TaxID=4558 RepID=A0A921QDX6_SORBI|nr:uncharacterized protein LOC8064712 [Sorghum bicolor]EES18729.1 hypothetical protein SORBI_3009G241400 [Sorghum bicolor]KAG0519335.1 hypothetical protein BDA96_09G255500 [Sorghum bicolor]|eukprot:XP_002440299.1 uncharacterized protein LOC8064712 [Sorghum bicolor]
MAASSTATTIISCCCCCLGPPAPPKESSAGARRPQAPAGVSVSSHALRRACVAAAACAMVGISGGGGGADMALALARGGGAFASRTDVVAVSVGAARAKAPPRWSDRRQCPPWRANSLENIVPENLPRPSAPRRFDSVSASAAAPDLSAPPSFLALRPGTGCFSL